MTDTTQEAQPPQNFAMISTPTLTQRFWRWAGFRYHLGDDPEGIDGMIGWMKTDIHLHFGWADRLRLALSGKLFVASVLHYDTPSPMTCKSRVDYWILQPGEKTER
jgi:hypothetical protein